MYYVQLTQRTRYVLEMWLESHANRDEHRLIGSFVASVGAALTEVFLSWIELKTIEVSYG